MRNFILLTTLFLLFGCKKENAGEADTELPVVVINSPSNNQVFSVGEQVTIKATITDNKKLEEIHMELTNTTTGTFITHEHYAPDGVSYMLNKTFTAQLSGTYRIKVEAHDLKGNIAQSFVNISAN
jgi:hypothetical protein